MLYQLSETLNCDSMVENGIIMSTMSPPSFAHSLACQHALREDSDYSTVPQDGRLEATMCGIILELTLRLRVKQGCLPKGC